MTEETRDVVVTGVEMFRKLLDDQAMAGDNVGLLLRGVQRDEIERGQVLAKKGTIKPHTHFTWVRFTFLKRKRAAVIHRSSMVTDRSSISEQPT